jgi:hypothetical protein
VFERVIRRLALAARYTSAEAPDESLRAFHRTRLLEQLQLRPIAGVMGTVTKRIWLRGYQMMRAEAVLDADVLEAVGAFIGVPDRRTAHTPPPPTGAKRTNRRPTGRAGSAATSRRCGG